MGKLVVIGISDHQIAVSPDVLVTYALGSCVGICIYDHVRHIGGLAHILLPEAVPGTTRKDLFKYADTAVPALVCALEQRGCHRAVLKAKIAGGATMFSNYCGISIGERNIEMVRKALENVNVRIVAEDVGLDYGRTVEFYPEDGSLKVKTVRNGCKII